MAGKRGPDSSDRDWVLSCWEWAGEIGSDTGMSVQYSLTPTSRPGVLKVVVRLLHVVDGKPAGIDLQVSGEWPNSSRAGLAAYLQALTMQLDARRSVNPLRVQERDA